MTDIAHSDMKAPRVVAYTSTRESSRVESVVMTVEYSIKWLVSFGLVCHYGRDTEEETTEWR
jgi:hypothetical protein